MPTFLKCNNCNTENPAQIFELRIPIERKYENVRRHFVIQFKTCVKCLQEKKRIVSLLYSNVYEDFGFVRQKNYKTIESAIICALDELPKVGRQLRQSL